MNKPHINFKQIRKKVTQNPCQPCPNPNTENIPPANPSTKVSFRGIKRRIQNNLIPAPLQLIDSNKKDIYLSPIKLDSTRNLRTIESSKEDCNKFSVLLESKGYGGNGNSGRKKSMEISFRTLNSINSASRTRLNTERFQTQRTTTEAEYKIKSNANSNNTNSNKENNENKADKIQQKCREIKQKNYFSSRTATGQLNSLNKLKSKLISPLKKKSQSQPEPYKSQFQRQRQKQRERQLQRQRQKQKQKEKIINIFEHSSILSQHDLVNVSKTNQSIDFDMSPWL